LDYHSACLDGSTAPLHLVLILITYMERLA
jgi:hypothetical protein